MGGAVTDDEVTARACDVGLCSDAGSECANLDSVSRAPQIRAFADSEPGVR
jgi:hypothetical protein